MADTPDARPSEGNERTPFEQDVLLLAERTALLLACLRNYWALGHDVDLRWAMNLEPEVMSLIRAVDRHFHRRTN